MQFTNEIIGIVYSFIYLIYILMPGLLIFYFIIKKDNKIKNQISYPLIIISLLILSPTLSSLYLYYMFLIFIKYPPWFYILSYLIIHISIFLVFYFKFKLPIQVKIRLKLDYYDIIILTLSIIYLLFSIYSLINMELMRHDMLEYSTFAKIIARDLSLEYSQYRYDDFTGFYYVGMHGYGFIFIGVWNFVLNDFLGLNCDYLFRFAGHYYTLCLLLFIYLFVKIWNKDGAIMSVLTLIFSLSFFLISYFIHLDTYRLAHLVLSTVIWLKIYNDKSGESILLWSVISGLSSFTHSINFMLFGIQFLIFVFYKPFNSIKAFTYFRIIFSSILFGCIHYIIDIFYGTGWIFRG